MLTEVFSLPARLLDDWLLCPAGILAPDESPHEQGAYGARDARQDLNLTQPEEVELQVGSRQLADAKPKQADHDITAKLSHASPAPAIEEHTAGDSNRYAQPQGWR